MTNKVVMVNEDDFYKLTNLAAKANISFTVLDEGNTSTFREVVNQVEYDTSYEESYYDSGC